MSRRSGTAALVTTITVTVFVAAATFVTDPMRGNDGYSAQVLENARARQEMPLATVPKPLETNLDVLREEDIMAEKVAKLLVEDQAFMTEMGDKAAVYVGEKISDLEEQYASDTIARIDSSSDRLEKEIQNIRSEALTAEDVMAAILGDKAFLESLASELSARVGKEISPEELAEAVVASSTFNTELVSLMDSYHTTLSERSSIPIPVFDARPVTEYSEEEYMAERNAAREDKIDKILLFLGY